MLPHNLWSKVYAALAAALVMAYSAESLRAQISPPADKEGNKPLPIQVAVQPGEIVGREQVFRQLVKCGTNEFLWVLPPGLRNESTSLDSTTLVSTDGSFNLRLRLISPSLTRSPAEAAQLRRQKALEAYNNATNTEDFTANVAGREAQGLQLHHARPIAGERLVRIVWVPCKAGTLEFALDSAPEAGKAAQQAMDCVLVTLRSNEGGKIEVVPMSDKS